MPGLHVLIEIEDDNAGALEAFSEATKSSAEAERQASRILADIGGEGIEFEEGFTPVPMFSAPEAPLPEGFALEMSPGEAKRRPTGQTVVLPAEVSRSRLDDLQSRDGVKVWPNSALTLYGHDAAIDDARSDGGVDCRPFRDPVEIDTIRAMLAVDALWDDGFRGQNIVVGILDEGVSGQHYPVIGGFARPEAGLQPGSAAVTSHGSMCAADVLVAAPAARLYDYPFLGIPRSGGAIQMFQAVLDQWNTDGTPQITNNSYGFVGIPDPAQFPDHEVNNINHPVHRKVREVVTAGVACFFAAGNCGENCPSGNCHPSGIGPGLSIHASNSLEEVITVAAVNSRHERVGYSSQGPGRFEQVKPDVASYTHFLGNYGPGRPAGTAVSAFDSGTSAATPVAAGVAAALLSAIPTSTPLQIKDALISSAIDIGSTVGWDPNHGHGVINAAAALAALERSGALVG
ncbi:S8 family serine peptidase [Alisedimentitalea sp. MJ-SS2]|uniref:S8 family serine peptidase n=1 Tax=Aliisedimentitalea sp. MJ-SS2 TaxID=3049795 RepID=UPI0029138464|nr:S8 family serine peptidase [Alisedimentitalea sp. MJ-SS2]MDU8929578.1 S8 family serine peptidase [Alisedimentitalea sp. MJ-SS2]